MRFCLGNSEYHLRQKSQEVPIYLDTARLINGHVLLAGMSGTGKSHLLRRMMSSAAEQGIALDVFDVHHDLTIPGAANALFSEQSRLGFNPLELNCDPHSGGVRKRINELVRLLNGSGWRLGTRQESVLRNLLQDVYYLAGIYPDNAASWGKQPITEQVRQRLLEQRDYQSLRRYYPCLADAISLCERKLKALYLGADSKTVSALEQVNRLAMKLQRQATKAGAEDADLTKLKGQAIEAFATYVQGIESGRELADVLKYNSRDVLQSVLERLQQLEQSGIFCPNPPPFGAATIRNYQINHLSDDEKRLLIYTRAEQIFREAQDAGIQSRLTRVLVVDEAHKFIDDDKDNIFNLIAKEARKFGLGLWCSSQSPNSFSEDFLTNVGTTILLPIHTLYWDMACRKLQVDASILKFCRAREVAAVKLSVVGQADPRFGNVLLPQVS